MSTLLAFFITFAEIIAVAIGYLVPVPALFDALVVYGSPMYFIMNVISMNTSFFDQHMFFPLIALFHVVKYLCLCRSQFSEERHSLHNLAIIFEIFYLVVCANYL